MELPKLRKIDPNKPKKKKILLLADDFRLPSGIGTISREIILLRMVVSITHRSTNTLPLM